MREPPDGGFFVFSGGFGPMDLLYIFTNLIME